jgi:hypothetical protein
MRSTFVWRHRRWRFPRQQPWCFEQLLASRAMPVNRALGNSRFASNRRSDSSLEDGSSNNCFKNQRASACCLAFAQKLA